MPPQGSLSHRRPSCPDSTGGGWGRGGQWRTEPSGVGAWKFGEQTPGCLPAGALLVTVDFSVVLGGGENEHRAWRDLHRGQVLCVNRLCQLRRAAVHRGPGAPR